MKKAPDCSGAFCSYSLRAARAARGEFDDKVGFHLNRVRHIAESGRAFRPASSASPAVSNWHLARPLPYHWRGCAWRMRVGCLPVWRRRMKF